MSVRPLKNGRWQADIKDKFRNIPRTKKTFDTRKEAEVWHAAVLRDGSDRLLGNRRRRLFGEALAKYLREESPKKLTHNEDLSNASALRWPYWDHDARRWARLEEAALDEVPVELGKWVQDLRAVRDRRYLGVVIQSPENKKPRKVSQLFQRRMRPDGRETWYWQPNPNEGERPEQRKEVTDPVLLAQLNAKPGRGPFASATLRVRQLLVSAVLRAAWRHWSNESDKWLEQDIAGKIKLEAAAGERDQWADYDTLLALIIAAPVGFDAAILGAAHIGWRRANILGGYKKHRLTPPLGWDHVVFPVYREDAHTGERTEIQHGYYWVDRPNTKTKAPLGQPMSHFMEQLFRIQWEHRCGPHVFHRGDGQPFSEIKRMWAATKKRAGVNPTLRWHDLRHTFASILFQAGAEERHVQELGGWKDRRSMQRYTHLRLKHLRDTVNISRRN